MTLKKFLAIWLPVLIILLGLFLSNGPLSIFFTLALWIWFLIMLFYVLSIVFYATYLKSYDYLDNLSSKTKFLSQFKFSEKNQKRVKKYCGYLYKYFLPFFIAFLISNLALTYHMAYFTHWKAEQNIPEFEELVNGLVEEKDNNESKARVLLTWFDNKTGNIYNDWRLLDAGHLLFKWDEGRIEFYSTYPFIGVRTYNEKDALWILTSQFGHCGEYSNFYRAMADHAGLRVRKVCTEGENHCWNEVYINDTIRWKIVDPTTVFLNEGKNGYDNVNLSWMVNKLGGNISFLTAQEIGDEYINITDEYTTEINITVIALDNKGNYVPGVNIEVFSNNRYTKRSTGVIKTTDNNGEITFQIGSGNYTFKAWKNDLIGENTSIFPESELSQKCIIKLEKHVVSGVILIDILINLLTWIITLGAIYGLFRGFYYWYKLKRPVEIHFLIPRKEHLLLDYAEQSKTEHLTNEIILPANSSCNIMIWYRPKINYFEIEQYIGCKGNLKEKPRAIEYFNPFVKEGIGKKATQDNHYIDWWEYYHLKTEKYRIKEEVYVTGFIVQTYNKGDFEVYSYVVTPKRMGKSIDIYGKPILKIKVRNVPYSERSTCIIRREHTLLDRLRKRGHESHDITFSMKKTKKK